MNLNWKLIFIIGLIILTTPFCGYAQKNDCLANINFGFWSKERGDIPRYVVGQIKRAKENNFVILLGCSTYDIYTVEGFFEHDSTIMSAYFIINRNNGKREKFPLFENRDISDKKLKSSSGSNLLDQCYDRLSDLSRRNIFNQRLIKPIYFKLNNENQDEWKLTIEHPSGKTFYWNYFSKKEKNDICSSKLKTKVENSK